MMGDLASTIFSGEKFDTNVAVIVPSNPEHVPALWCYCGSDEFEEAVRQIDQKRNVTNATLVKIPFDLAYWSAVAAQRFP